MTLLRELSGGLSARSAAGILLAATGACATVKIVAPDEPIEINLNIKIEQELRLKLDKEAADLIEGNPDIF